MNLQDIRTLLEQGDGPEDLAWEGREGGPLFTIAHEGEEECDGKWCFQSTVLQEIATSYYYEITTSRSNSGYWGDSERGDTTVVQVKPRKKIIETTVWEQVK